MLAMRERWKQLDQSVASQNLQSACRCGVAAGVKSGNDLLPWRASEAGISGLCSACRVQQFGVGGEDSVAGLVGKQACQCQDIDAVDSVPARRVGVQPKAREEVVHLLDREAMVTQFRADVGRRRGGVGEECRAVAAVGTGTLKQQLE